jgi:hypothetical protein
MSDVVYVNSDQFAQVTDLLNQSRTFYDAAKSPALTMAQKLAFQKQARDLREHAMAIGR